MGPVEATGPICVSTSIDAVQAIRQPAQLAAGGGPDLKHSGQQLSWSAALTRLQPVISAFSPAI